jgi:hypothetical protein
MWYQMFQINMLLDSGIKEAAVHGAMNTQMPYNQRQQDTSKMIVAWKNGNIPHSYEWFLPFRVVCVVAMDKKIADREKHQ